MTKKIKLKTKLKSALILLMFLLTAFYTLNNITDKSIDPNSNTISDSKNDSEIDDINNDLESIETPKVSSIGSDPWWNTSFSFRRLINITNPYPDDPIDCIASITFNYSTYVAEGKMNSSLKDVRIIENNVKRNFFIQIDYPNETLATIWFETNLTDASKLDQDTYMYYGNNTVGLPSAYYNKDNRFGTNWWRLDDGEGTTPDDTIGTDDGIFQNSPTWTEGKVGGALDFDGNSQDDHVEMQNFDTGSTFIVSGWVKGGGNYQMPWGIKVDAPVRSLDQFHYLGTISNNIYDSASNSFKDGGSPIAFPTDDLWHHYVWENIGGGSPISKLWLDGQLAGIAIYRNPTTTDNKFQLSCCPQDDNYHWDGQIDDVRIFSYGLSQYDVDSIYNISAIPTSLNDEQDYGTVDAVKINLYDVDGGIVPHAFVSLINMTNNVYRTGETLDDGSVTFRKINSGIYNITVKYNDTSSGMYYIAYNSTEENYGTPDYDMYDFSIFYTEIDVQVDLWTIDFEIFDWDSDLLKHSYINVSDTLGGPVIDSINLVNGKGTFVWKNQIKYYYKIFYDNEDYTGIPIDLNQSYIHRSTYEQFEKYYNYNIWVNQTNESPGSEFRVQYNIYTNNSAGLQKRLLKTNITLSNMKDYLHTVKIYYLDENGNYTEDSIIYYNNSYNWGQEDFIEIDLRHPPKESSNLIDDDYQAYGMRIDVYGVNTTGSCNGTIDVKTIESCYITNRTDISKMHLRVIDTNGDVVPYAIISINNSIINGGNKITSLITDVGGYAHGQINTDTEFLYVRGETYNFSLGFHNEVKNFVINETSDPTQWAPKASNWVKKYNFTLYEASALEFKMQISIANFLSEFKDLSYTPNVTWGQNITISTNYTISSDGGGTWEGLNDPDEINFFISDKVFLMTKAIGDGNFTVEFNSSCLSVDGDEETYLVSIDGNKLGYVSPMPIVFQIKVIAIETKISFHNYSNPAEITTNYAQHYNELINITIKYYDNNTKNSLYGATLQYKVLGWVPYTQFYGDPLNDGYYTFTLNTSDFGETGVKTITIMASIQNYKIALENIQLEVLDRVTLLNGHTDLVTEISSSIYIKEGYNFTFTYIDRDLAFNITDLKTQSYTWKRYGLAGGVVETGSGNLVINAQNQYVLDFDTETRSSGTYTFIVTLDRNNYEIKIATISLVINYRTFDYELGDEFEKKQTNVVKGKKITLSIELTDESRGGIPLTGAKVILKIGDDKLEFDEESDGVYELEFDTEDYEAFFASNTLTGQIEISKADYISDEVDITIVVEIEEITEGVPTFYFIMVVAAIAAIVGSLATYKYIQIAQIPTFVKKARKIKKSIKSKKPISEALLYPSKEVYMVKALDAKYKALGLSLDDLLGLKGKGKTEDLLKKNGGVK